MTSPLAKLLAGASQLDFVGLVRGLERVLGQSAESFLRIVHDPRLAFLPRDLQPATERAAPQGGVEIEVHTSFLGLVGAASPLPLALTESVLFSDDEDESALGAVLDVLHTRALLLLYEGSRRFSPASSPETVDPIALRLRTLVGVDPWATTTTGPLEPSVSAGLADHRRGQIARVDPETLKTLLAQLSPHLEIEVLGVAARDVPLDAADQPILGDPRCRLGEGLVCGASAVDIDGRLRLRIGPVDRAGLQALMPQGADWYALHAATRWLLDDGLEVELEVVVASGEAPKVRLGEPGGGTLGIDAVVRAEDSRPLLFTIPLREGAVVADSRVVAEVMA